MGGGVAHPGCGAPAPAVAGTSPPAPPAPTPRPHPLLAWRGGVKGVRGGDCAWGGAEPSSGVGLSEEGVAFREWAVLGLSGRAEAMGRGQRGGLKRGRGPVMGGVLVGGSWGKGRSLRRRGGRGLPEELPGFDWLLPPRLVLIWGKKMGVVREGRGSKGRGQGREKGAWLPTWEERHLVVGGVRRPGDPEVEAGPGGGRSQVRGEVTELSLPSRNPQKLLGGDRAPPRPTPPHPTAPPTSGGHTRSGQNPRAGYPGVAGAWPPLS